MVTEAAARVLGLADYGIRIGGPADFVAVEAETLAETDGATRTAEKFHARNATQKPTPSIAEKAKSKRWSMSKNWR
jgi:cytosine/adenosine deaminase-related metal-dependent hydrolase